MILKIGIIGCGVIGTRRGRIINSSTDAKVIAVADVDLGRAKSLGEELNCEYSNDWKKVISRDDVDAVVVSTTNDKLAQISYEAAIRRKHIFCEKPLGTNVEEVRMAVEEASKQKLVFKTGFTLRFHPGIQKIKSLVDSGELGRVLFIRCRYGITGRPGYEKEWRAMPEISGGGELIDQGIHVLDLFRWFLGDFLTVYGSIGTLYWNMKVEDNALAILKTTSNQIASLHVSWTQWNNIFSFEIFGSDGYAIMEGLGGAYGKEKITVGKKAPPDKWPPEEKVETFDNSDLSWNREWENFVDSIKTGKPVCGSGIDGLEALKLVFRIYDFCSKQ